MHLCCLPFSDLPGIFILCHLWTSIAKKGSVQSSLNLSFRLTVITSTHTDHHYLKLLPYLSRNFFLFFLKHNRLTHLPIVARMHSRKLTSLIRIFNVHFAKVHSKNCRHWETVVRLLCSAPWCLEINHYSLFTW